MNKNLITDRQAISIMALYISGSTLMFGAAKTAKEDIWLAIILSFLAALLVSLVYGKILSLFPGKDIFTICVLIFGKTIGGVFCFLYAFFAMELASLVLFDYAEFMTIIGLNDTPKIVSMLSMMLLILWIMKEEIIVFSRWSRFFVVVTLAIIFITLPLFIVNTDFNNLKPILYNGISPVFQGALSTFTFPFAETVLFMGIFSNFKCEKSPYKIYIFGLTLGALIIFVSSVMDMLVLGPDEMLRLFFPPYTSFKHIDIKYFFTRIEIVIGAGFLIGGFAKIVVCLITCCKGISEIFSISDYRIIVTPICIFTVIIAASDFNSLIELVEWDNEVWRWWALLYQILLPMIILGSAEVKARKGSKKIKM